MSASTVSSLFGDLDVEATIDAPIGASTWYGIGGRADLLLRPSSIEALSTLIKRCQRTATPVCIFGSGANLLVADDGIDGVVIRLDASCFKEIKYNVAGEQRTLKAMAGADTAMTLMDTARHGLEGLSQMAGIPATIGGAIRMNAGGKYGAISDHLRSITCISKDGELVTYTTDELRFGYRETNIPDPIIVSAIFDLTPDDPVAVRDRVKEIFSYKKSTQPLAESSAGCTFKNPVDPVTEQRVPAGKLIEQAGLKGHSIGGASVSKHHANFIVVQPSATADHVLKLLDEIQHRVFDTSGLQMEREIVIWKRGDDDTDDEK